MSCLPFINLDSIANLSDLHDDGLWQTCTGNLVTALLSLAAQIWIAC